MPISLSTDFVPGAGGFVLSAAGTNMSETVSDHKQLPSSWGRQTPADDFCIM